MSQAQILDPIGVGKNWFTELDKRNTNRAEALKRKGFTGSTIDLRYQVNGKAVTAKARPLPDVVIVWRYFDKQGNEKAEALIELLRKIPCKTALSNGNYQPPSKKSFYFFFCKICYHKHM